MGKIISDQDFKVGQKVRGVYMKYTIAHNPDSRVATPFRGKIVFDFADSSYEIELDNGEDILVELYDEDTMEIDE